MQCNTQRIRLVLGSKVMCLILSPNCIIAKAAMSDVRNYQYDLGECIGPKQAQFIISRTAMTKFRSSIEPITMQCRYATCYTKDVSISIDIYIGGLNYEVTWQLLSINLSCNLPTVFVLQLSTHCAGTVICSPDRSFRSS